jgi:hypothetical protein
MTKADAMIPSRLDVTWIIRSTGPPHASAIAAARAAAFSRARAE